MPTLLQQTICITTAAGLHVMLDKLLQSIDYNVAWKSLHDRACERWWRFLKSEQGDSVP